MKKIIFWSAIFLVTMVSCDTVIHPELESANAIYIVDAFITNKMEPQVVKLMYSQPYFFEILPPGVSGATIVITDNESNTFTFTENPNDKGSYQWIPVSAAFGKVGNRYTLSIKVNGESFVAESRMGRVPAVDSITFARSDRNSPNDAEFYRAQFWAKDPQGPGDTYWIRTYKNGELLNKPDDINLAYDAAFTKGSNFDGFTFIQPIRSGINPNDTDANDKRLSPYIPGDSLYVEIHSLTEATFDFLNEVAIQTNRPGGFSELFARPLANVSTNIVNETPQGTNVQGFFNVGSVSGLGKRFKGL